MKTSRTRLMAISGATLALVVAGTAVVSAHPGGRGDERGGGKARAGADFERGSGPGGLGVHRGEMRGLIGGMVDSFVRRETTADLGDAGIVTHRVDNGTVTSAAEGSLDYTLATGETASVTVDADTQAIEAGAPLADAQAPRMRGNRGNRGPRMLPTQIAVADIPAGADVVVWAESQDDGSFLAQRVVVRPTLDESADAATDAADTEATADSASA